MYILIDADRPHNMVTASHDLEWIVNQAKYLRALNQRDINFKLIEVAEDSVSYHDPARYTLITSGDPDLYTASSSDDALDDEQEDAIVASLPYVTEEYLGEDF